MDRSRTSSHVLLSKARAFAPGSIPSEKKRTYMYPTHSTAGNIRTGSSSNLEARVRRYPNFGGALSGISYPDRTSPVDASIE